MATTKLPTLTLTKGLPGSGKSTWAKEQVQLGKAVRVNKDDLRNMLHDGKYSKSNEKQVIAIQHMAIEILIGNGINVIIDDTNLNPTTVHHLIENFSDRSKIEFKDFMDVPVEVCIERDSKREGKACVGPEVILRMYEQYRPMTAKLEETIEQANARVMLPAAVIVDVDGTLCHNDKKRSPFDWKLVGQDRPDLPTIGLVQHLDSSHVIIVMSGRDSVCRPETEAWLKQWNVPYDHLFMRAEGDQRRDTIIKEELYNNRVRGKFDVKFAIDDRDSVCTNWRLMGIKCYQAEPGCF